MTLVYLIRIVKSNIKLATKETVCYTAIVRIKERVTGSLWTWGAGA